jgi:hypothetical protein
MSVAVEENDIPPSMPLMEPIPFFYDIFKSAPDKQKKLQQLERALELFIQALSTHEADASLKEDKIKQARRLVIMRKLSTVILH